MCGDGRGGRSVKFKTIFVFFKNREVFKKMTSKALDIIIQSVFPGSQKYFNMN